MPDDVPTPVSSSAYTSGEKRMRISVYVGISVLTTASGTLLNLASMSDAQLASITALRWTLTILMGVIAAAVAGLTVLRAAIDRSTSAPASPSSDPAPKPADLAPGSTPVIP